MSRNPSTPLLHARSWRPLCATTLISLTVRNFRRYFVGQVISRIGTWMQRFAQSWLVFTLSDNPAVVGAVLAVQSLPVLLIGPYGGVIADRMNRRRLMVVLQSVMGLLAAALGTLVLTHVVSLWHVFILAALLGIAEALENPPRQAFVFELVGRTHVPNAVALNSVLNNTARALGPAVGAVLIAQVSLASCFLLNAASFGAVVASLLLVDPQQLRTAPRVSRAPRQLREGLRYARSHPEIRGCLLMMLLIGTLAWEFQTVLPPLSDRVLHAGATGYGLLTAMQGVGAVLGGLVAAGRRRVGLRAVTVRAAGFGAAMIVLAVVPNLALACVAMVLVGFAATSFSAGGNATLQTTTVPQMRGRVMSLWTVAFQGSTPIGGPIDGLIAETAGARAAVLVGAASCWGAVVLGWRASRRVEPSERVVPTATAVSGETEKLGS